MSYVSMYIYIYISLPEIVVKNIKSMGNLTSMVSLQMGHFRHAQATNKAKHRSVKEKGMAPAIKSILIFDLKGFMCSGFVIFIAALLQS